MLYKKGDIILHNEGYLQIGIVLHNQEREGSNLSTETIHRITDRDRRNNSTSYGILNRNRQWNVNPIYIKQKIGYMHLGDIKPMLLKNPPYVLEPVDDDCDDDWYETEEEDDD